MTCSRCQTINPQGAVACAACGAPLVAMPMQQGYAPPGQPYMVPMTTAPHRSGIPKVVGILMIVFGSIMILIGLAGLAGDDANAKLAAKAFPEFDKYMTMAKIFGVIGLAVSGFHLFCGIQLVKYKQSAPAQAAAYAIASIVTTVINLVLTYAWLKPAMDKVDPEMSSMLAAGVAVGGLIAIAWPIIVLALVTRPAAKSACVN